MTDRELLEAAAKAAGGNFVIGYWNPLTDDGDALRLAVRLRLDIDFEKSYMVSVWSRHLDDWVIERCDDDPYAATRRAIVRAAAAIGRSMK
jgi:hypothetical protein